MKFRLSRDNTQTASEYTSSVSCNTLARGLVLAGDCRNFKFREDDLVASTSYQNLLCATKGYFQTRPCCNITFDHALTLEDGRYSHVDRTEYEREICEEEKKKGPKIVKQCVPGCKKKQEDPEHYCFTMAVEYDSYTTCHEEEIERDECDCYDAKGVLYPLGEMRPPRKERQFAFPETLQFSRLCGELDPCRPFRFEYCSCKYCGSAIELFVPTQCGFITLERIMPHPEHYDHGREPDEVDGKFKCYHKVCVEVCPHGKCDHPHCKDGFHHHEHCDKKCRRILADVVCEKKTCQDRHQGCIKPSRCRPCDHKSCHIGNCDGRFHHHHLCDHRNCLISIENEHTPLQDLVPGSHTKRLGVLGFDKGASHQIHFPRHENPHYKKKIPHT